MVKIYIFEFELPIRDKDKTFLLSELDSSEIKILPNQRGKNFELSLIGHVLTKKIVSDETHISKKDILIGKTVLGKPIIKRPSGLSLDINISHSGSCLVIGICDSGKIGVDIEILKDLNFGDFKNCLSVSEEKYINSGKEVKQKLENFYEIWTRKESYSKTLGIGLQRPLPITQFSPSLKPRDEIKHNNQQYYLSTLKEDSFILSVCTTQRQTEHNQIYTKLTPDRLWSFVTDHKLASSNVQNRQGN